MKKTGSSIVKPTPLKGWRNKKAFYIPVDSPYSTIYSAIEQKIQKKKASPLGTLFKLKDSIVLYHCIGAPLAVLSLERLIVSGAQDIIIFGFCGALNPNFQVGEAVSIKKAYSEEGTSSHYFSRRSVFNAGEGSRKRTEDYLNQKGLPFHTGTIVSTDAPYRETHTWLKQNRTKGIDCVDMETSAAFALAEYYKISASALMLVSDKLTHNRHRFNFHSLKLNRAIMQYFIPLIK